MAYEQQEGWGTLFRNEKKTADKQPDYRGEAKVNGELVELAMWKKTTSKGGEMLSISIKEKQAYQPKQESAPKSTGGFADVDDDIPF